MTWTCPKCAHAEETPAGPLCPVCGTMMGKESADERWMNNRLWDSGIRPPRGILLHNELKSGFSWCTWAFDLPIGWRWSEIYEARTRNDALCRVDRGVGIYLKNVGEMAGVLKVQLKIGGRGEDGRCRWCKSFRSALFGMSKAHDQYMTIVRPCRFDGQR